MLVTGNKQIAHQVDNIAAGEVRSGFLVIALRKPLDEVLKNVAHIHGADLVGAHISLIGTEIHDNLI